MKRIVYYCLVLFSAVATSLAFAPAMASASTKDLVNASGCTANGDVQCIQDSQQAKDAQNALKNPQDCTASGSSCNLVDKYVNPVITLLTILVGIAVTIGIVFGGIQYASSGGDPQKAASGKTHITKAIVALLAFFLLYGFLKFLIPGTGLLVG